MKKRLQFERTDQERRHIRALYLETLEKLARPLDDPDEHEVLAHFRLENPREFRR